MKTTAKHWTNADLKEDRINWLGENDTFEPDFVGTPVLMYQQNYINLTHCELINVGKVTTYEIAGSKTFIANCTYKFNKSSKGWKNFIVCICKNEVKFTTMQTKVLTDVLLTDKQKKRIMQRIKELLEIGE